MMKLNLRTPHRSLLPFLLALALAAGALLGVTAPAGAAGLAGQPAAGNPPPRTTFTPPPEKGVAIAEMATVRLVTDYTLSYTAGITPAGFPPTASCTGEGVLVSSVTPDGKAGKIVVLTDNSVINKDLSCTSDLPTTLQTAIRGGTFKKLTVYLNTAFSGATPLILAPQLPSDPSADISAVAGTILVLVTLPVTPGTGTFQDEPTVTLQNASTTNAQAALDLTNDASPSSSLTSKDLNPTPDTGKTAPDASKFVTPQARPFSSPATGSVPGTPVIDSQTGDLVSMIDGNGAAVPVSKILSALLTLTDGCPKADPTNCLGNRWQQVMGQYYPLTADGKGQQAAKKDLAQLAQDYNATFKGAQDFLAAIPTKQNVATASSTPGNGTHQFLGLTFDTRSEIAVVVLVVLLLVVILLVVLIYVRKVLRDRKKRQYRAPSGGFPQLGKSAVPPASAYAGPQQPGSAAASYTAPPQAAPTQRTIICPRCSTQNNAGSSNCVKCGLELPQGVGGVSGVGRSGVGRSTSGGQRLNLPSNPPPVIAASAAPDVSEIPTLIQPMSIGKEALEVTQPDMVAISPIDDQPTIQGRPQRAAAPRPPRPPHSVKFSTKSDRGKKRAGKENEDNFLAVTGTWKHHGQMLPFGLFVVADGMGGHANGQDASKMAVETIYHTLGERLPQTEVPDEQLPALLQQAVQEANKMIFQQNQLDHADMGCTLTAALVTGNEATICNVGDSRTYILPEHDHLRRVTTDHSIVQSLVDAGVISKDDVYTHPKRNQIYRSLGEHEAAEVDVFRQPLGAGDKLLLCCDGLWEMIRDPDIEQVLRHDDLSQVSSKLIDMANENGGVDNITAIVVQVGDEVKNPKGPMIQDVASGPANSIPVPRR